MNFESVETWVTVMIIVFAIVTAWNPAIATMNEIKTGVAGAYTFVSPGASAASVETWDILRGAGTAMLVVFLLVMLAWAYLRYQRRGVLSGVYG
jgi:uncharacterized membrane protein YgaE (UPF0421/DUF939 family)